MDLQGARCAAFYHEDVDVHAIAQTEADPKWLSATLVRVERRSATAGWGEEALGRSLHGRSGKSDMLQDSRCADLTSTKSPKSPARSERTCTCKISPSTQMCCALSVDP